MAVYAQRVMHFSAFSFAVIVFYQYYVRTEQSAWLMELFQIQDEWKSVSTMNGAQCVMIFGMIMMLQLSADNLDCHQQVMKSM